jgi:hypothetical protein
VPESFTDAPLLTARFDAALHAATRHHARQLRKGTPVPYAAHLLAAASLVLEMHGDEDEAIGALLHDVVEDGGGRAALAEIAEAFGPVVAELVAANSDAIDAADRDRPWYERKRRVRRRVPAQVARGAARLARRQGPQRPLDPARLPHPRGRPVGAVRPGPGHRDADLLPRAGPGVRARARAARARRRALRRRAAPGRRRDHRARRRAPGPGLARAVRRLTGFRGVRSSYG